MAKSSGRTLFGKSSGRSGFGRRGGTVTVIEDRVARSYARTAKIAFYVIACVVGLLAAAIATSYVRPPLLALLLGALIGVVVAVPVAAFIAAWPVIRVIWWWTPEIATAVTVVYGFTLLADHTGMVARIIVLVLVAGTLAGVPVVRRRIVAVAWCVISRHRLRACFNQFIISNRSGNLPLILWAKPTPVGERVWIWLRPGLALDDLQSRLDKIAVACWASTVTVEKASKSNAAYVRIDIKRRDALTGTIASPLRDLVTEETPARDDTPGVTTLPTALDLPDVPIEAVTASDDAKRTDTKPRADRKTARETAAAKPPVTTPSGADVSDWI